jgi:hypothetical protein
MLQLFNTTIGLLHHGIKNLFPIVSSIGSGA